MSLGVGMKAAKRTRPEGVVHYQIQPHFSSFVPTKILKKLLVIKIAENILTKTPTIRVKANPLTKLVPNAKRITLTIKVLELLSRIEGQALLTPSSTLAKKLAPLFLSSRILEKIKIFASTAIPIERIKPAIPAKVRVTENILKAERTRDK